VRRRKKLNGMQRTLLGAAPEAAPAYTAAVDDFDTTETYRVTLIFLAFVVLSLLVCVPPPHPSLNTYHKLSLSPCEGRDLGCPRSRSSPPTV
jgi:hypothetical protein